MNFFLFPNIAQAALCSSGGTALCNPTNAGSIDIFIKSNIFSQVATVVGVLVIAMVIYSGARMIMAQGNEEAISKARSSFQWSIAGLIVVVSAFVIVNAIGQFFGYTNVTASPGQVANPIGATDLKTLLNTIITAFLSLAGVLAILFIIINGLKYLTARGNDEQVESAKKGLTWSIIGFIIILLSYVIVVSVAKLIKAA